MSVKTMHNPARFLSPSTLSAIKAAGVTDLYEYVSNIESKLRSRGENDLADTMIEEIEESVAEDARNRDEEKKQRELDRAMGRQDH